MVMQDKIQYRPLPPVLGHGETAGPSRPSRHCSAVSSCRRGAAAPADSMDQLKSQHSPEGSEECPPP